jgi:hypothetical protein
MIESKRLMCGGHWQMVPRPLQNTIWRLYRDGNPRDGHLEACASAVEQVNAKVGAWR